MFLFGLPFHRTRVQACVSHMPRSSWQQFSAGVKFRRGRSTTKTVHLNHDLRNDWTIGMKKSSSSRGGSCMKKQKATTTYMQVHGGHHYAPHPEHQFCTQVSELIFIFDGKIGMRLCPWLTETFNPIFRRAQKLTTQGGWCQAKKMIYFGRSVV